MELIISIIAVASIFGFLQLETALQRYFYEYEGTNQKIYVFNNIILIFIFSLIVPTFLEFNLSFLQNYFLFDDKYNNIIRLGIWQIPFITSYTSASIVLRFEKRFYSFIILVSSSAFVNLSTLYYFLIYAEKGLSGFFQAQLISLIVTFSISLYFIKKWMILLTSVQYMKYALSYALPQFPARMGSVINTYFNRFYINNYLTVYSLGLYSMAFKISSVFQLLYQVFLMFWTQTMFEFLKRDDHDKFFIIIFKITSTILFSVICFFSIFSKTILLIVSPKFQEAHYLVGLISFSFCLMILKEIVDIGPKYLKKTAYLNVSFFLTAFVNIILSVVLVPKIGLVGVGIAFVVSNFVLFFSSLIISNYLYFIAFDLPDFLLKLIPVGGILLADYFNLFTNYNYQLVFSVLVFIFYSFFLFQNIKIYKNLIVR
jgi:O-antigen/teichoic acid export membrane protein